MCLKLLFKFYFSLVLILMTIGSLHGQCYAPFIALDCYGGLELDFDSTFRQANERHISQWGWDNFNELSYEKNLKIISGEKYAAALDSVFQAAKYWVINKIGEENYCKRIEYLFDRFRIHGSYKQKDIRGEFILKFHYQPITCWTGRGVNLVFKFQELKNGKFDITFPTNFPKCSKEDSDFINVFGNGIDTTKYAQWAVSVTPYRLGYYSGNTKIYSKIFPLISKISQSEFHNYNNVNLTGEKTLKWLAENGKERLSKKNGLEIWMLNFSWNKQLNMVNGNVMARSTTDLAYLLEKEFVFEYDTMYVGPFGVKNKSITLSRFRGNPSGRNDKFPAAGLTENYDLVCEDLEANSFKVRVKSKGIENLMQLYPIGFNKTLYSDILFSLNFKIKEHIVKENFELVLKEKPFKKVGKYYEPLTKKKKKFAFQKIVNPIVQVNIQKAYPKIETVFPKNFTIGDTITILGENLDTFVEDVYCPCSTIDKGIEFRRHCLVPQENIIFTSYQKIKFIVPKSFDYNKDELKILFPDSGTIRVRYERSSMPITFSKNK